MQERRGRTTTHTFARVPRGPRSSAVPVADTRATTSAPATASVPPAPASTSGGGGVWSTPRTKPSIDVVGVEAEVDAGTGGTEAVAGAEVVALVSATGTAYDL